MSILVNADNWGFSLKQEIEPSDPYEGLTWYDTTGLAYMVYHDDEWIEISLVPTAVGNNYGYNIGGYAGGTGFSIVDRIEFPFDSGIATQAGNMAGSNWNGRACNSSNYGFVFGGIGYAQSTIERISFPFDSGTATEVGLMSRNKTDVGACNSSNYGFCMNGFTSYVTQVSTIDRITFPFDSGTASAVGVSSYFRGRSEGANSSSHGYVMGGMFQWDGTYYDLLRIDRLTFPFGSGTALLKGSLNNYIHWGATFNSSTYGYYAGGSTVLAWLVSRIDRITFPFDSGTASTTGNLSNVKSIGSGSNSTNYGYVIGGGWASAWHSTIDRILFPFDSGTASHVGNLAVTRGHSGGLDGTDFVTLFN